MIIYVLQFCLVMALVAISLVKILLGEEQVLNK